MLIVLDENFNITAVSDAYVNQGDAALGKIQVIAPYPNNIALVASFTLPDGFVTPRYPLVNSVSATDKTKTIYTFNVPATVFSLMSGTVQVQFFALLPNSGKTNEYSCMLNVKSSGGSDGKYPIEDTYICDKSLTAKAPEIIATAETAGLSIMENTSNNAYYLTGTLATADTALSVTVKVTYAQPTAIATAATNFTVRKGTAFNLPTLGDVDQNTWTYIVQTLAELSSDVSKALESSITTLKAPNANAGEAGTYEMWLLETGYYKVEKGAVIYLSGENESLTNPTEDMLLFVSNDNLMNASYVCITAYKFDPATTPVSPEIYYGYSNGGNAAGDWQKDVFKFGAYVTEPEVQSMINAAVITTINTPV